MRVEERRLPLDFPVPVGVMTTGVSTIVEAVDNLEPFSETACSSSEKTSYRC